RFAAGAANTLLLCKIVVLPASFPATRRLLQARGLIVEAIDIPSRRRPRPESHAAAFYMVPDSARMDTVVRSHA
ncbi:MAG TPA: hypothetical protein VHB98_21145, partial [Chloroflexota bacterium]|nr:hypothetical protein [Chloroflexota bacterium]